MKFQKILASIVFATILFSCGDEPDRITFKGSPFISVTNPSIVISENSLEGTTVQVIMSRTFDEDVTVSFSVTESNATEGIDYSIEETSITIPAGEYEGELFFETIDNDNFDAARKVTVTLTEASLSSVELSAENSATISILNDDCPVNTGIWAGDVDAFEDYDYDDTYNNDDWGYTANFTPNEAGDCDILLLWNMGDWGGSKSQIVTFTPDSEGATFGTVSMPKQLIGLVTASGERAVEGTGTYDETTKIISMDCIFYLGTGAVYYESREIFYGN